MHDIFIKLSVPLWSSFVSHCKYQVLKGCQWYLFPALTELSLHHFHYIIREVQICSCLLNLSILKIRRSKISIRSCQLVIWDGYWHVSTCSGNPWWCLLCFTLLRLLCCVHSCFETWNIPREWQDTYIMCSGFLLLISISPNYCVLVYQRGRACCDGWNTKYCVLQ